MTSPYVSVSVKCAECGKLKGDVNHWYIVSRGSNLEKYAVYGFYVPVRDNQLPVCGESCLNKLTSKILSEKKPCAEIIGAVIR